MGQPHIHAQFGGAPLVTLAQLDALGTGVGSGCTEDVRTVRIRARVKDSSDKTLIARRVC
jgi:hypothetical protein